MKLNPCPVPWYVLRRALMSGKDLNKWPNVKREPHEWRRYCSMLIVHVEAAILRSYLHAAPAPRSFYNSIQAMSHAPHQAA